MRDNRLVRAALLINEKAVPSSDQVSPWAHNSVPSPTELPPDQIPRSAGFTPKYNPSSYLRVYRFSFSIKIVLHPGLNYNHCRQQKSYCDLLAIPKEHFLPIQTWPSTSCLLTRPSLQYSFQPKAKVFHDDRHISGFERNKIQRKRGPREVFGGSIVGPGRWHRDIRGDDLSRRRSKSVVCCSWRRWCVVLYFRICQFLWVSPEHLSTDVRNEFLTVNRVYQEYYQSHQLHNQSPSSISWIGSLQVFFLFAGGVIGGPLFDRYGAKVWFSSSAKLEGFH